MPFLRLIFTALILPFALPSQGQMKTPEFARYLVQGSNFQEVIDLQALFPDRPEILVQDSLDYYTAWSYFNLKMLPQAIDQFSRVSNQSGFYQPAKIFGSWCQLFSNNPKKAKQEICLENGTLLSESEVFRIQMIAIQLKQREYLKAQKALMGLMNAEPVYLECLSKLSEYTNEALQHSDKSLAVAGILSGILPGSGKVYAGEKGAGISSFLILAGLGGVAVEHILKTGLTSWNSLLLTGLFGTFYVGNIYGSLISIKTYRERFYEGFDQAVLATVLLPLRDFYR